MRSKIVYALVILGLVVCAMVAQQGGNTGGSATPSGPAGGGLAGTYPNPTVATVPASALPNPSSSTLGGIQSLVATAHLWINSISTLGVPNATQPACADLSNAAPSCSTDATNASNIGSGTLGAGRLPTITLTGDTTGSGSSGSIATTTAKINGTAFAGASGNLVGFGASNTPTDTALPYNTSCGGVGLCLTGQLTAAQILALTNTSTGGITLLAGQGAGTMIVVDSYVFNLVYAGTAFAAGSTVQVSYNLGAPQVTTLATNFVKASANTITEGYPSALSSFGVASTILLNQPLTINLSAATQYTCSATCSPINYTIKYHVISGLQ